MLHRFTVRLNSVFASGLTLASLSGLDRFLQEGIITDKITGKSNTPNIRALGNYCHIKKKGGLMFCPECLDEDKIPYFRKIWRLKEHIICKKHNIKLLSRCSNCSAPLTISKSFKEKDFIFCYKCGNKL